MSTCYLISAILQKHYEPQPLQRPRIVGGEDAADGEFPHQVSLRSALNFRFCGGSVIDKDWVVTAAHCCAGQSKFTLHVLAGGILKNGEEGEEQKRNVQKILMHEEYDPYTITNDTCLLHVWAATIDKTIDTLSCISEKNMS